MVHGFEQANGVDGLPQEHAPFVAAPGAQITHLVPSADFGVGFDEQRGVGMLPSGEGHHGLEAFWRCQAVFDAGIATGLVDDKHALAGACEFRR